MCIGILGRVNSQGHFAPITIIKDNLFVYYLFKLQMCISLNKIQFRYLPIHYFKIDGFEKSNNWLQKNDSVISKQVLEWIIMTRIKLRNYFISQIMQIRAFN